MSPVVRARRAGGLTMTGLADFQRDFAAALVAPDAESAPDGFEGETRRRFRVYRNNYFHGLSRELRAAYPVVHRLVGDAFFAAMAYRFLAGRPPRARSFALFGDGFADFVADFPPAASLPYLADVTRLERARLEALHAADAAPIDPARLCALGDAAAGTRFRPHPAARLVASEHPIVSLWEANRPDVPDGPREIAGRAEAALVTRPADAVLVRRLDPAQAAFAAVVLRSDTPIRALGAAQARDPRFDPVTAWQALLAGGALAGTAEG